MTTLLLVTCLVAAIDLPFVDLIDGEVLNHETATALPSGRHLGWQADHLFLSPVNMQPDDGGAARFDRLLLSTHGRGATQQRLLLNGLDITDPAQGGSPLLEIPDGLWQTLHQRSLWTSQPGFEWTVKPDDDGERHYAARGGLGRPLGGGTWIPRGLMDREPASDFGAPSARRGLTDARAAQLYGSAPRALLAVDYVRDARQFPQTYLDANGHALTSVGERTTVLGAYAFDVGPLPLSALAAWQSFRLSGAGAEYRWPQALVGTQDDSAVVMQLTTDTSVGDWHVTGGYGFGYRDGSFTRPTNQPMVSDLEGEWLWMARPRLDEQLSRWRQDLAFHAERHDADDAWALAARASYAALSSKAAPPGGMVAHTYDRATNGVTAAYLDLYDPSQRAREWLGSARAEATWKHAGAGYRCEGFLALDYSAVGTPDALRLGSLAPALGGLVRVPMGDGEGFALLRREPDVMTEQVSAILDPARPSGRRYVWADGGDGVPTSAETGALVSRFGGAYTHTAGDLSRPTSNQLALGYTFPLLDLWRATITGVGRLHLNRYTVHYDAATQAGFTPVAVATKQQSGPYSLPYGSGGVTTAYARTGAAGAETYVLDNDNRPDFWLGAEIALATVDTRVWFVSLSAAAYWNAGAAPFGDFADRNDPGVIDSASADPNAQINDYGRYDQDRSFSIKLAAGYHILDNLLVSTALRYRDGEPFDEIGVVEGLPQGPTPVMLLRRGIVRHTYHMSLDLHAAYTRSLDADGGFTVTLAADVMNLLGSGTEQLEDPRTGASFRRPLEMVPGRSGFVSLALGWN